MADRATRAVRNDKFPMSIDEGIDEFGITPTVRPNNLTSFSHSDFVRHSSFVRRHCYNGSLKKNSGQKIEIVRGDITKLDVDAHR